MISTARQWFENMLYSENKLYSGTSLPSVHLSRLEMPNCSLSYALNPPLLPGM